MPWVLGNEYDMVTVSLNTKEKPARAKETQTRYLKDYGKNVSPNAWKFLVGDDANVAALASAVGFGYKLDPQTGEYQHTAAVMVLTPEGKVSRYLYGVEYSPQTLRLSLAEASQGKFTSTLDQVVLYCFKYNATAGTYTPVVRNIMKIGAGVTVLLLGVLISSAWWLPKRRKLASAKA